MAKHQLLILKFTLTLWAHCLNKYSSLSNWDRYVVYLIGRNRIAIALTNTAGGGTWRSKFQSFLCFRATSTSINDRTSSNKDLSLADFLLRCTCPSCILVVGLIVVLRLLVITFILRFRFRFRFR